MEDKEKSMSNNYCAFQRVLGLLALPQTSPYQLLHSLIDIDDIIFCDIEIIPVADDFLFSQGSNFYAKNLLLFRI